MSPYLGCVLFSLPVLLIYLLGAAKHLSNSEPNTCDMTYMFERPQYVRIQLQEEIEQRFPRYGLYAYGEGFTLTRIRAMRFHGIPVLFIPGNAGSHQQVHTNSSHLLFFSFRLFMFTVRSLASVSFRKSLKDRTHFHFDFFTVDLHEEYSALHGGILTEQTEFVSHCVQRLLKFYSGKIDSVILIGHSMGGIVSKGILLEPTMKISQVNTIIMLATPHRAALVLDTSVAALYQRLQESEKLFNQSGLVTISVGGGPKDVVVNSNQIVDRIADLNVLTTHIPGVWKSTDHLSILWCKEFVLSIIRAMFDSVDTTGRHPRISSNKEHRLKVFNYHLLQRTAGKKMGQYQAKVQFEPGGEWIEDIRRQYTWKAVDRIGTDNKSQVYLMIRLIGQEDCLTIQTINLDTQDWLFACSASAIQGHSRVCEWGWNLTNKSRILLDDTQRRKTVDLDLEELKTRRLTHVVVRIPSGHLNKGLSIGVDLHKKSHRVTELKNKFNLNHWGFGKVGAIESNNGAIRYEMNLNNIDSVLLKLINIECNHRNHHHSATVELLETWISGISQVRLFTYQDMTPKLLEVQTRNEANGETKGGSMAKLRFTFDPECVYTIEVWHSGFMDIVASIVRDRWPNLYGVIVGLLLLALGKQVDHEKGFVSSTVTTVVTLVLCCGVGIGLEGFVSLAILHVFGALVCCTVVFFGSTVSNIAQRFLARALKFSVTWSDWVLGGLNQVPLLAATVLLSIIPVTCGALAMSLFVVLQFLKLLNLYEGYLEQLLLASLRFSFMGKFRKKWEKQGSTELEKSESNIDGSQIGFHLVLFLVWCAAAVPAIPSVLVWAKNYRYSVRLTTEDSFLTFCWMIIVGCGSAGITYIPPSTPGYYFQEVATVLRLLGWAALMVTGGGYPGQYQYLMPPFIAASVGLLAIHPLMRFRTTLHK